jgi:hypothetical protein
MTITPTPKKDLRTLTKLEKERELKKLRGETEELIDEMGHTNEKRAAGVVKEYVQEQQKKQEEEKIRDIDQLKLFSSNKKSYQRYLILILHRFIKEEAIPATYKIYAESNDTGIVVGIEGTTFTGAFKVCGIPFYDANACKVLAVQLGNTIAKLEGHVNRNEAGIIIPDFIDQKKYAK